MSPVSRRLYITALFCGLNFLGTTVFAQTAAKPPKAPDPILQVYQLQYAKAHDAGQLLKSLFSNDIPFLAAVDERTNRLIVRCTPDSMPAITAMLQQIDTKSRSDDGQGSHSADRKSYRVHIDWLLTTDQGQPVPEKLRAVEESLARHGISGLQLAAATITSVQTKIDPQFSLSCSPLKENIRLEINGSFIPGDTQTPGIHVEISASEHRTGSRNSAKQLANITTSVSAKPGHPVVLAVAPIEGVSSVFVVTIENAEPTQPSVR